MRYLRSLVRAVRTPLGMALAVTAVILIPSSLRAQILGETRSMLVWGLIVALLVVIRPVTRLDRRTMWINLFMLAYLAATTVVGVVVYGGHVAPMRILAVVVLLWVLAVRFDRRLDAVESDMLLSGWVTLLAVWGAAILLRVPGAREFTFGLYNMFQPKAGYYSMLYGKPVGPFAVHTYAALFYTLFFVLAFQAYRCTQLRRYLAMSGVLTVLTLALASQSAMVLGALQLTLVIGLIVKRGGRRAIRFLWLVALAVVALVALLWRNFVIAITSPTNGIVPRYVKIMDLYGGNLRVITHSPGIGFAVLPRGMVNYSDSGFIVYATMGSVVFLAGLVYVFWRWTTALENRYTRWLVIAVIALFEFTTPSLLHYRVIVMLLMMQLLGAAKPARDAQVAAGTPLTRAVALALYYGVGQHVPNRLGGVAVRRMLVAQIFAECGRGVAVSEHVYFGSGRQVHARDHAAFGRGMKIFGSAPVIMGEHCIIGPDVTLETGDHKVAVDTQGQRVVRNTNLPITIGDYTFVGGGVTVLGGTTVGDRSVVAAGAVVVKDVSSEVIVGGVPARVIKPIDVVKGQIPEGYVAG